MGRSWPLLGALGALLGRSWALLVRSWVVFGASWRILGRLWAIPSRFWCSPGCFWGSPGRSRPSKTTLGPTREHDFRKIMGLLLDGLPHPCGTHFWSLLRTLGVLLGALWAPWGSSLPLVGPSGPLLGPSWGTLGTLLGSSWHPFGPSWAPLGELLALRTLSGCPWIRFESFFDRFSHEFPVGTAIL